MPSHASSFSESESWRDARTSFRSPSPIHEDWVDSNIKRYPSTILQGRYGLQSAMTEGALHFPPRTGSPASDHGDYRSAHGQSHHTGRGHYTPSSVLQNIYGSFEFPSNNPDFHYKRTAKSDCGFPTYSRTRFSPLEPPTQRSGHQPFLDESTSPSFPISNRPGLSPLQRLSPEAQQLRHGPGKSVVPSLGSSARHDGLASARAHPTSTRSTLASSSTMPEETPIRQREKQTAQNDEPSGENPVSSPPAMSKESQQARSRDKGKQKESFLPSQHPDTSGRPTSNRPQPSFSHTWESVVPSLGSSARHDGPASARAHPTSTRSTLAFSSTRPEETPIRQREKQTAQYDEPSGENPAFPPPATSKESQQARSRDRGKQKESFLPSQHTDILGRLTSNRSQPSFSQTAHLDAPAVAVPTSNDRVDNDGDIPMDTPAESLRMPLFSGSQADQSPPPPPDREIQPPSCQSRHIRPWTTYHRSHQNNSSLPKRPEYGASLDRGMEPASYESTHLSSKNMRGPSPSQAGPSTLRPRTVDSSRHSSMTTPQDHEMEFLRRAGQYRQRRTPGNSGEPRERHDAGYDGEEEDIDQDGFDDAGDQFSRQPPRDMFGDEGRQYPDEAEEMGDKLDPNDLYPGHEAEPGQEGGEDGENPHQHFVTRKVLKRHLDTVNNNINTINDNMNAGFSRIFSLIQVVNGSPSHTRSTKRGKKRGPKITGLPERRTAAANAMAANVRRHFHHLMKNRTLFAFVASNDDVFEFEAIWKANGGNNGRVRPCCTVDNFRVDLAGLPRSPWNASAAHIFCMDFIHYQGLSVSDALYDDVLHYFYTRIKGLKAAYAESQLLQDTRRQRKQARRRWQRKRATFLRRLEIADSHHLLQAHVPILQQLGVDGMSSDESDLEELERDPPARQRRPRFFVCSPLWRKRGLSAWLRVFDAMHIYERRSSGVNLRGAYPRYRVHKIDHFSRSKKFVSHLPLSAYNRTWLEDNEVPNFTVCPNHEENYDFTHHPDVHALVDVTITNAPEVIMPFY